MSFDEFVGLGQPLSVLVMDGGQQVWNGLGQAEGLIPVTGLHMQLHHFGFRIEFLEDLRRQRQGFQSLQIERDQLERRFVAQTQPSPNVVKP